MYSSEYVVGDLISIHTQLRLRKVFFLSLVDGWILYETHIICTVMYSCIYIVPICNVTTIKPHLRVRKVFFFIFSRWIDVILMKHIVNVMLYILVDISYWCVM